MWDIRVKETLEGAVGSFSVSCKFRNAANQFVWMFSGVYRPTFASNKRLMWAELAGVQSWWDESWCLGGDFSVVRFP